MKEASYRRCQVQISRRFSLYLLSLMVCVGSLEAMPRDERTAIKNSLYGLQQLRSVIPERLWQEEFAILIDTKAFEKAADEMNDSPLRNPAYEPTFAMGESKYYLLYAATTGEPIRLDDQYLQFLNSPYWNAPEVVHKLYYLQHNHMKVAR